VTVVETIGATVEPVNIQEGISQLRLTSDSGEDAIVKDMISASRAYLEDHTGLSLASRTLRMTLDSFPDVIELTKGPVTSITSISYYDTDNALQTINVGTEIISDLDSIPARITPLVDGDWPDTQDRINAVSVVYVAGYTPANIPKKLKMAILAGLSHYYDNRGDKNVHFPSWILTIVESCRTNQFV